MIILFWLMVAFNVVFITYETLKWIIRIGEYSMEKKTKFKLNGINNHTEFTATVEDHSLHPGLLDALKHKLDDLVIEFDVTGEISIVWDDYTPMVTIEGIGIAHGDNEYFELDLSDDNFNWSDLIEQIEQDDNINYYDYMAGQIDYQYDLIMEAQRDE